MMGRGRGGRRKKIGLREGVKESIFIAGVSSFSFDFEKATTGPKQEFDVDMCGVSNVKMIGKLAVFYASCTDKRLNQRAMRKKQKLPLR